MIDRDKLQEEIYKYEYLLKDARAIKSGLFAEKVFEELLGSKENEVYDAKQNYCKRDSQMFGLHLQESELSKKYLYILQILPFQAKIHYYKYDLQQALKDKHLTLNHKGEYEITISFDENYKYITFSNDSLKEYIDDLKYNNPNFKEFEFDNSREEKIQKNLLKQEGMNFEEMPYKNIGFDIKINNTIVELKATKNIQKNHNNTSFALEFNHTSKTIAEYFILSYIFEDNQDMINIIMKNYNYEAENIKVYIPKLFEDIVNDTSLSDSEKIEKIKQIHIQHKGHELNFYTTKEVKEFFDNL